MAKYLKLVLGIGVLLALGGVVFYFVNRNRVSIQKKESSEVIFPENPQKGQYGYKETETAITIGKEGTSRGGFEKVEDGSIFINSGTSLTQYPLTLERVVVSCTTQDLGQGSELKSDLITDVKILSPDEIGNLIPKDEVVILFATDVEGTLRVHTVAMDASKCK